MLLRLDGIEKSFGGRALFRGVSFDVRAGEYVDMIKAGIIDPAKVARVALESAASVAGLMLTTDVLVTDLKEEDADKKIQHAVR